ncbi:MAG: hypothetical protein IKD76_04670 [Clostridia bacterium]|nr:hypothetical protein [Clostridia bacterium]
MKVRCFNCNYEFTVKASDISVSIGDGVPFVSCRNPKAVAHIGHRKIYCNTYIDLSRIMPCKKHKT